MREWIVPEKDIGCDGAYYDYQEVIRCKDCAIRYDSCPLVVRSGGYIRFFSGDEDFCSGAKRKLERKNDRT